MKCIFMFLLTALLLTTPQASGQLLLQEDFLTPTTDITTTTGWSTVTGVGSTVAPPYIVVNAGSGLQYPNYIESGTGNSAYCVGTGQDAQVAFTSTALTGSYYLAFMVKIDSVSSTGDYFWMVRNSSNHNRWRGWVKRSADGEDSCYFGVSKGTSAGGIYSTKKFKMSGTTHLLVAKYDFNTAGANDALMTLWIDPPASSFGKVEPTSSAVFGPIQGDVSTADFIAPGMNRLALIQNTAGVSPTLWIGGIRFATDWKTVLPPSPLYFNFSGSGDPADVNNWGANLDGTGAHPSDFAADNQWYLMRNPSPSIPRNMLFSGVWIITGTGSKLIVGSGVNFQISAAGYMNGTVDVSSGASLTLQAGDNLLWPQFGTNAGTVNFDNAAGFTLTGSQVLPSGAGDYVLKTGDLNVGSFTLTTKGRLNPNGRKITGTGTFVLDSAGTLIINSVDGISTSGATGDIQTGTRIYSKYGSYQYAGSANQVTGTGIPDTVLNLTLNMANSKLTTTLSKSLVATSNLSLTSGKCVLGNYNLNFNNPGGYSDSSYVITNGTGALIRPISSTSAKTMPVGSAIEFRKIALTFETTPATIRNVGFQFVAGDTASVGFPKGITYRYKGGYWKITSDTATNPTYKLDVTVPLGFVTDTTSLRVLWRSGSTSAWDTVGGAGLYLAGVQSQAGIDKFGQFALGVGAAAPPPPPGKRYQSEVFSSYQIQSSIQYGTADTKQLLDLYTGTGDVLTNRPLVVFVPGGGFKGVNAPGGFSDILCGGLAKSGYAVAYIKYYRTNSSIPTDSVHFETMLKALQDVKAAVRFLRKNGKAYGIDTSQIFVTGSSAGSITALHLAYLDSSEVPKNYVNWSNIGGTFDGPDRGTPGVSSRISAVISNWGAIGDTAWMKNSKIPVYNVHGTIDSTVFYDAIPADGPFKYSGKYVYAAAQKNGITTGLRVFYNTGHTLDNNAAKQDSAYKDARAWLYDAVKITGVEEKATSLIPSEFALHQNYPNPFNPATTIMYDLPKISKVSLIVYNLLGQEVARLVDNMQQAGTYKVTFDASRLASGVYFYRLVTQNQTAIRKMLMLK